MFKIAFLSLLSNIYAGTFYYSSGLLKEFKIDSETNGYMSQIDSVSHFLEEYFQLPEFDWRESRVISDGSHVHLTFEIFYRGQRVQDRYLRIHYRKSGFIDYATSDLEIPIHLDAPNHLEPRQIDKIRAFGSREMERFYGEHNGEVHVTPIIWISKDGMPVWAYDVWIVQKKPLTARHLIMDSSLSILSEKKVFRNLDVSNKVFETYPTVTGGGGASTASKTLQNLTNNSSLSNSYFTVVREQNVSSPTTKQIDPDYSSSDSSCFSNDTPYNAGQDYQCTNSSTSCEPPVDGSGGTRCANHEVDGINVYYHLENYRRKLNEYLTSLGATVSFSLDPVSVIVNTLSVDPNPNTVGDEFNNALYATISSAPYLIFFPPLAGTISVCGSGSKNFHSVAREGTTVIHEYQHYVTDTITGLVSSSTGDANVGDALHEGYSDYFATSQVSALSGQNVAKLLNYSFQNCSSLIRDLSSLKVYENTSEFSDPHIAGWSWASGLWKLRSEFITEFGTTTGRENMDKLALKSLFFLSTLPGFVDAVEALVQADALLYNRNHVSRIRQIFYDDLNFVGGANPFSDSARGVVDMGFNSCSSVHGGKSNPIFFLLIFVTWLLLTVILSRRVG